MQWDGAVDGARIRDLALTKGVLYQLSYNGEYLQVVIVSFSRNIFNALDKYYNIILSKKQSLTINSIINYINNTFMRGRYVITTS